MLEKREFDQNDFLSRLSTAVAVVSGLFSIVVFLLLLTNYLQVRAADPVNNLLITQMRQEYAALPEADPALAQRIRDLELLNRKAFFTSQDLLRTGAVLLLVGVSVFLISFKYSIRWRREKPALDAVPTADVEFLARAQSRQLIAWAGVGILGVGLAATLLTERTLARDNIAAVTPAGAPAQPAAVEAKNEAEAPAVAPASDTAVAWETIEANWPTFRGPGGYGIAHYTTAPVEWDVASGSGVRWKTEMELPGANSPVVWDGRVFLSGADKDAREVYCYDADTGKQLWKQKAENLGGDPSVVPKVSEDTGFAAPTMAAVAGKVFAIFANGDLVCYDLDGKQLWGRNVGVPKNHYGHASSLIALENLLYVQLDQTGAAKLMALDAATGKDVWDVDRKTISWASPILARTPFGPQLVLNSESTVDAYDPHTGAAVWSEECLDGEVAPSPAYNNGVVFVANEYATATAIQLEKADTAVEPKIAWQFDELLPEVSSPVGDGERFYYGTSAGEIVCLDAKTGQKAWVHTCDEGFLSSPVLVGDRIYILDKAGNMYIVRAGNTFELIATHPMGEAVFATPAYLDGRIIVRTEKHLYCIEQQHA